MNFPRRLRSFLERNHPNATLVEMRMPSGNVWVDIKLCGTLFVVQYERSHGFGVSAIRSDDGLDGYGVGHDRYFPKFADALLHLENLGRREERRCKGRTALLKAPRRVTRRSISAAGANSHQEPVYALAQEHGGPGSCRRGFTVVMDYNFGENETAKARRNNFPFAMRWSQ